jgi:DNA topoisomerase-1
MAVVHLLRGHFPQYVDLQFTAKMEDDLDEIATGQVDGGDFLASFYWGEGSKDLGLLDKIEKELPAIQFPAIPLGTAPGSGEPITVRIGRNYVYVQLGTGDDSKRATLPVDLLIDELTPEKALNLIQDRVKGEEPLGQDPQSGQMVYVLTGPYGPYVQLGEGGQKKKPKRVTLPRGKGVDEVDLDYALRLLSLPRSLGSDPDTGKEVTAGLGRFGPFVHRAGVFASLESMEQLFAITLEEAVSRINAKNSKAVIKELGPHPDTGAPLQVLRGRYGPYVTDGELNATLGKEKNPAAVTLERAVVLLTEAAARKKAGPKKKAGKKATTKKKTVGRKKTTPKKSPSSKKRTGTRKKARTN